VWARLSPCGRGVALSGRGIARLVASVAPGCAVLAQDLQAEDLSDHLLDLRSGKAEQRGEVDRRAHEARQGVDDDQQLGAVHPYPARGLSFPLQRIPLAGQLAAVVEAEDGRLAGDLQGDDEEEGILAALQGGRRPVPRLEAFPLAEDVELVVAGGCDAVATFDKKLRRQLSQQGCSSYWSD
jgi:hypothetical protein